MATENYVVVRSGVAGLGSISWDGVTPLDLPKGAQLVREADWSGPREALAPAADLRDRADKAIALMQAHVDRGTFTAAQRDAAILLLLRVAIVLVRLVIGRLDDAP